MVTQTVSGETATAGVWLKFMLRRNNTDTFTNPVLSGFYPDPSICKKDNDYYLVTSSMEFFPCIPVFHSTDLVHWRQIGHVLEKAERFDLKSCEASGGIMAPTIRYYKGTFYVTCSCEGNHFICTTEDPETGWNDPVYIDGAEGIDNSLFFDDDGRCYYHANCILSGGERCYGDRVIWLQEFDYCSFRLIGPKKIVFFGAGGLWCEAPHIYKENGCYYLICAEGGTMRNHSVICARSDTIWGPYQSSPANPLLTSRHLSRSYPIQNIGHLDMVKTQNGEWWAVALGSRPYGGFDDTQRGDGLGGYFRNLGRETFLLPMTWERDWPVFCPDSGKVELTYSKPRLPDSPVELLPATTVFSTHGLGPEWNFVRTPIEKWWQTGIQGLTMKLRPQTIAECVNPSFIGRRQQHFSFTIETLIEFDPRADGEEAGLVLFHNRHAYITFLIGQKKQDCAARIISSYKGKQIEYESFPVRRRPAILRICTVGQTAAFYICSIDSSEFTKVVSNVSTAMLNSDATGSHTGTYVGMYATSNGKISENTAVFRYFSYTGNNL